MIKNLLAIAVDDPDAYYPIEIFVNGTDKLTLKDAEKLIEDLEAALEDAKMLQVKR